MKCLSETYKGRKCTKLSLDFKCTLRTEKKLPVFISQSLEYSFVQRRRKRLCFIENAFNESILLFSIKNRMENLSILDTGNDNSDFWF